MEKIIRELRHEIEADIAYLDGILESDLRELKELRNEN